MTHLRPEEAAAALLQRRRMRESLLSFAEGISIPGAPVDGNDPNDWGRQIEDLRLPVGGKLTKLHKLLLEKVQETMLRPYGRLMVFMPPGSAKSTYCSSVAPAWYLGKFPGHKIVLASYADELARKHGKKARSIVEQPIYKAVFNGELSKSTSANDEWHVDFPEATSEYMAGSFLSGITGNRANGVIIDDPIKGRNEADNPQVRARTLATYQDDILTRFVPGAWMILIQTRWHAEDLAGSLLPSDYDGRSGWVKCTDGMMWYVLNVPAECERADDPLGRPIGDGEGGVPEAMLWPEWFTEQHWAIYRVKPRTWSALFQQRPQPEGGGKFKRAWFKRFDLDKPGVQYPKYMALYLSSDYAVTDEEDADNPDFTEHGVWGVDDNYDLWALDWFFDQCESDDGVEGLMTLALRYRIRWGINESGVIRRAIEPIFRDAQRRANWPIDVLYLPHIGNKVTKAQSFIGLAQSGRVHVPRTPWGDRLIDQLCDFPGKGKDDAVDVCSNIGRAISDIMAGKMPVQQKEPEEPKFGTPAYFEQKTEDGPKPPRWC